MMHDPQIQKQQQQQQQQQQHGRQEEDQEQDDQNESSSSTTDERLGLRRRNIFVQLAHNQSLHDQIEHKNREVSMSTRRATSASSGTTNTTTSTSVSFLPPPTTEQSMSEFEKELYRQQQHYENDASRLDKHQPSLTTTFTSSSSSTQQTAPLSPQPSSSSASPTILNSYSPDSITGRILTIMCRKLNLSSSSTRSGSALPGFLALLLLTMANYMLSPMRDAAALAVGVSHIPTLTLASTVLAFASSVPMGWLFEAPDPMRKGKSWRDRIGLTRGETQGTSLALFLRCYAICLVGYAVTFKLLEWFDWNPAQQNMEGGGSDDIHGFDTIMDLFAYIQGEGFLTYLARVTPRVLQKFGKLFYVVFFLVVHLMKLHSLSLIWGVTSEAMDYEEQAESREVKRQNGSSSSSSNCGKHHTDDKQETATEQNKSSGTKSRIRLKRLAFVGFGGTLGGIMGSVFVSMTAHSLKLSGLLIVAAILLSLSAELSVELGQIMLRYWQQEQLEQQFPSDDDLLSLSQESKTSSTDYDHHSNNHSNQNGTSFGGVNTPNHIGNNFASTSMHEKDPCLKKISSLSSMKRVASGNSLGNLNNMRRGSSTVSMNSVAVDACMKKISSVGSMKRIASVNSIASQKVLNSNNNLAAMDGNGNTALNAPAGKVMVVHHENLETDDNELDCEDDNTFKERLLRGIKTILRSRLLLTIFTYNALYATTTTLLSFQRAELVANRSPSTNSVHSDTAFLAKINIMSSVAVFALQASGLGAYIASSLGQRGTLSVMPLVRMFGVGMLILWHLKVDGTPPNLTFFLVMDEFTKVINFAVAKPVRESLWRGLSNEARYEAKPIVDTLANRWGSGSAAFLLSFLERIMCYIGVGEQLADGSRSIFGCPPLLILCAFTAAWWAFVSADLGYIRHRIDMELKKQQ